MNEILYTIYGILNFENIHSLLCMGYFVLEIVESVYKYLLSAIYIVYICAYIYTCYVLQFF